MVDGAFFCAKHDSSHILYEDQLIDLQHIKFQKRENIKYISFGFLGERYHHDRRICSGSGCLGAHRPHDDERWGKINVPS